MYWTAGGGYQYQDIYGSLTYFGSRMNDGDMLHDIALGAQYDLSPAGSKNKFVPYLAVHYFLTGEKQNASGILKLKDKKDKPAGAVRYDADGNPVEPPVPPTVEGANGAGKTDDAPMPGNKGILILVGVKFSF